MTLIDTHCHLDFEDFAEELPEVVARADVSGVRAMITIGTCLDRALRVKNIAERFDNVYCSIGIHPHEAEKASLASPEDLVVEARHPKVVAIGETGLDYHYDFSPRVRQQQIFRYHIAAARQTGLPLVIHTRNADEDMRTILTEEMEAGAFSAVIHCFSSSRALAETVLEFGFYLSVSGIVTFPKADELRSIIRDIPLERLLVETDAPYLTPVPHRGKRNEPAFVALTARSLAEIKGVPYSTIAEITTDNALTLFKKMKFSSPDSQPGTP